MRWFRPVHAKSAGSQEARALYLKAASIPPRRHGSRQRYAAIKDNKVASEFSTRHWADDALWFDIPHLPHERFGPLEIL